jgi:probable rRNA maturation factor
MKVLMVEDKVRVIIVDKQKEVKIPTGIRMLIRRCCNAILKFEQIKGSVEVSVILADNAYLQSLNKQYRNKDVPTDVLSFSTTKNGVYDIDPETGAKLLGDIIISVDKVVEQSNHYGHAIQREMAYLVAHGLFHLLGYDHEKSTLDKANIREKEEKIMEVLGLSATSTYAAES